MSGTGGHFGFSAATRRDKELVSVSGANRRVMSHVNSHIVNNSKHSSSSLSKHLPPSLALPFCLPRLQKLPLSQKVLPGLEPGFQEGENPGSSPGISKS